jgi:hypothetical protein
MSRDRFLYQGSYYALAPQPAITPDMALMSGTAEGVIFTPPTRGDMIEGGMRWLFSAAWARGQGLVPSVIDTFIDNELASGHFLQPGDIVEHRSSHLGNIVVEVSRFTNAAGRASRQAAQSAQPVQPSNALRRHPGG